MKYSEWWWINLIYWLEGSTKHNSKFKFRKTLLTYISTCIYLLLLVHIQRLFKLEHLNLAKMLETWYRNVLWLFANCRTNFEFLFWSCKNVLGFMIPWLKWSNSWSKYYYFKLLRLEIHPNGQNFMMFGWEFEFWGWNFFRSNP